MLAPMVRGTIFARHIQHYFSLPSTNVLAMQLAGEGQAEGTVIFAEEQTSGRGRGGHSWHSEKSSGIYCSVILRPQLAPADLLALSLAAGLAVQSAVRDSTGMKCDLRWPNDVLIGEKKFCGILIEVNAEVQRVKHAVVGVGINVNQRKFPVSLQGLATSLQLETGNEAPRVPLAAALLKSLDREYRSLSAPAEILRR